MNSTVNDEEVLKKVYARQKAVEEGKARKAELERVETLIALETQVGGNHYKNLAIQPVEYITANNLSYLQGSVIKYVTRYQDKNGVEDLQKAIHFVKMMIQEEEDKK